MSIPEHKNFSPTKKQLEYLCYIVDYTKLHGVAPAFADIEDFFKITPPSVNQMINRLEKKGLIEKERGKSRSIKVLLPDSKLPTL